MKKFFKIVGVVLAAFILIGILLPDPKKADAAGATALAQPAGVEVTPREEQIPESAERPELEVLKTSETANEFARTIHVKVRNNSDHLISYADLKGVYYDGKNDIVGTGIGNAANIAAGATKTIDIMSTGVEGADRYEVEVGNVLGDM
jgi:hypothetical protein